MGKPKTELEEKTYYKDIHFLYEIIHSLRNVDELKIFLKDILTRSELRMLKRRWHIANLLAQGHDIRTVARKSKTSTQTVSKIKNTLEEGYGGLQLALKRSFEKVKKEEKKFLNSKKTKSGSRFIKGWLR